MKISLDLPSSDVYIRHYEPGNLVLNQGLHTQSVIITHTSVTPWMLNSTQALSHFEAITPEAFEQLFHTQSDVILLGSGETQGWLSAALTQTMAKHRRQVDVMPSKAACRTYNLLAAEGRWVTLGLIV